MNTVDEILDYAIDQEQQAADFYEDVAQRAETAGMKKILLDFSEEEKRHKKILQTVKNGEHELTPEQEAQAKAFEDRLDSPLRVIIEIIPEKWIMLDSDKMAKDTAGELTDEERGPLLEADAERLPKALEQKGIS